MGNELLRLSAGSTTAQVIDFPSLALGSKSDWEAIESLETISNELDSVVRSGLPIMS